MKPLQAINFPQMLQAIRLLQAQAKEEGLALLITNHPTRTFRGNMISRIRRIPEDQPDLMVAEIHFSGLYGGMGSLPDYFTDAIIAHRSQINGLRDFLDLFNHRLLDTLHSIWRRQQVFLENLLDSQNASSKKYDRFLRALGGLPDDSGQEDALRCLSRHHLRLFQRKPKTTRGLLFLLKTYFPQHHFSVDEHVPQILDIPEHQRARLDPNQSPILGSKGSFLIGSRIQDINGKIRLSVTQLTYQSYMAFLPGGKSHQQLCALVNTYTESQWAVALQLALKAEEVPQTQLSGTCRLGANGWLLSAPAQEDVITEFGKLVA